MDKNKINELKSLSLKVREHIIGMSEKGGCFVGSSFSCADVIVYLYSAFLNINKNNLSDRKGIIFSYQRVTMFLFYTGYFLSWAFLKKRG